MQIVIKIKDTAYEGILNANKAGGYWGNDLLGILCNAVSNGTPLPKGHGRLKDVDHYIKMEWEHPDYSLMDDEPTIIEAESEA